MEDKIEYKQPLPFPFYDSLEKQNRYKVQCTEYTHSEYLIMHGCYILPFQIRRVHNTQVIGDITLTAVNITNGAEEDITAHLTNADWNLTNAMLGEGRGQNRDFISYYGRNKVLDGVDCVFNEGCIYYLKLFDGEDYYYSELFRYFVADEDVTNIIKWNAADYLKHDGGVTDLLISKK